MADDNQFLKYSRYAIGEIVLVVVGILIALQINNWNEKRQQEVKVTDIFEEILRETEINIEETKLIIDFYQKKDSLINLVLNDKLNSEDYEKSHELYWLIENHRDFNILDNGYSNLMENSEEMPTRFHSFINKLKHLYNFRKNRVNSDNMGVQRTITEYRSFKESSFTWYSNANFNALGPGKDDIDFYLTDPIYKNKVYTYKINAIGNLLKHTILFRSEAIELYYEIAEILSQGRNNNVKSPSFKIINDDYSNLVGTYIGTYYGNSDHFEIIEENNSLFMITEGNKYSISFLTKDSFLNEQYIWLYKIIRSENGEIKCITYPNGTLEASEYLKVE